MANMLNMTTNTLSMTGSWGSEKLAKKLPKDGFDTTYARTFNTDSLNTINESKKNEFAKFVSIKADMNWLISCYV
jgi:hypothetical protein